MREAVVKAEAVRSEQFPLAHDPEAAALLEKWTWYTVEPDIPDSDWPQRIATMRGFIEAAGQRLSGAHTSAWLSLFGPFLPDGVLGAAAKLIDGEAGGRFALPSVHCGVRGPGYVEALLNVEWQPGCLARLFEPAPGAASGFLPCNCRASLMIVPADTFMDFKSCALFNPGLTGTRLVEGTRQVLTGALHLALPNLDFEHCYLGTREPRSADIRALLGDAVQGS